MELWCGTSVSIQTTGTGACLAFAKEELMSHLLKMFTKINFTDKLPDARILLTIRKSPLLHHDGYQIVITEKQVHISAAVGRGILHGVYHLLRLYGCSFWFSKTAVQNVPTVRRKTLPTGVYTENPLVKTRGVCLFGANKKTVADVLATIDFMAKNNYNLLLTVPVENDEKFGGEHDIKWDEICDTVLPHLIKRGIDISLGMSDEMTDMPPLGAKDFAHASVEQVAAWADNMIVYLQDKPYVAMLGPWPTRGKEGCRNGGSINAMHEKNQVFSQKIKEALPNITILHTACDSECPQCPNNEMPENVAALLAETQDAFAWSQAANKSGGAYILDRTMGDSFHWQTNLWLQPYHAKAIVAAAANASCEGVISLWTPISAWRTASINFALLKEAFYHPDFSVENALHTLCEDLWGVMAPQMYNALSLTIAGLQDIAIWSRPPRCSPRICDHINKRNKIFDAHNAKTFAKRASEIEEIINNINITRLDEHGIYHLDFFKTYIQQQREYFTCIDQFSKEDDTAEKLDSYFKLLQTTFEKSGEGFVQEKYAKQVIKKQKLI